MPEKEYIEREASIAELRKVPAYFYSGDISYGIQIAIDLIAKQPTADVAVVVRCKDCKHKTQLMGKAPFAFYACSHNKGLGDNVRLDDFCSYGERKGG